METTLIRRPFSAMCTSIITSVQSHPLPPTCRRLISSADIPVRRSIPTTRTLRALGLRPRRGAGGGQSDRCPDGAARGERGDQNSREGEAAHRGLLRHRISASNPTKARNSAGACIEWRIHRAVSGDRRTRAPFEGRGRPRTSGRRLHVAAGGQTVMIAGSLTPGRRSRRGRRSGAGMSRPCRTPRSGRTSACWHAGPPCARRVAPGRTVNVSASPAVRVRDREVAVGAAGVGDASARGRRWRRCGGPSPRGRRSCRALEGAQEAVRAVHGQVVHAVGVAPCSRCRRAACRPRRCRSTGRRCGSPEVTRNCAPAAVPPLKVSVKLPVDGVAAPSTSGAYGSGRVGPRARAPAWAACRLGGRLRHVVGVPRRCPAARTPSVSGSAAGSVSLRPKSKAEVRSPQTARRHGEMFGSLHAEAAAP